MSVGKQPRRPLPRYTRLAPGGPIKAKKRKPSEFRRIYGSKARVAWVKARGCAVRSRHCYGEIQNAHTETGGMSYKAGYETIAPLCLGHHAALHANGPRWFEAQYAVELSALAAQTEAAWQAFQGRTEG